MQVNELVTNVTAEYMAAEKKFHAAKGTEEKIAAMEEMISQLPKHKSSEKLYSLLKKRLAALRKDSAKEKAVARRRASKAFAIKKEGFQIALVGMPGSGKSTALSLLTNAKPQVSHIPFTTKEPIPGMMEYGGAPVQLVEIPAFTKDNRGEVMGLISSADGILLVIDSTNAQHQLDSLLAIVNSGKKMLVLLTKTDLMEARLRTDLEIVALSRENIDAVKKKIFSFFDLIRVFTKEPREKTEYTKPLVLKRGSTVLDAAKEIHKDFAQNLRFARVWGSAKYAGQRAERDYVLQDGDIVEFHI